MSGLGVSDSSREQLTLLTPIIQAYMKPYNNKYGIYIHDNNSTVQPWNVMNTNTRVNVNVNVNVRVRD